ncbi:hypothetical protein ARMSODRAFT_891574 [Armillaria solidipes]|uniref:Myb/SANT-like domain-containing protein n=1 Tax=Armillaria solidipes TaxID=1076256 RepID=A0A2H3BRN8_9AGAR|nr:hypothetical protein ARMSODRAFT_891574 [Armillaria solidipes]
MYVFFQLKKKYWLLQHLKNLSGFGWDNKRKMVTATNAVWEMCIKVSSYISLPIYTNAFCR